MVIENAINIYTDGSSFSHPRLGGIGIHIVIINDEGFEEVEDISPPGFVGATNNAMELYACTEGIKQATHLSAFNNFRYIDIHTDSLYVVDNYNRAIYEWSRNKWFNRQGKPVENAELWKKLIRIINRVYSSHKIVRFHWVEGHSKDKHNRAADKLAKKSAKNAINPPLSIVKARRKRSSKSVEPGCVPMLNQGIAIRIITEEYFKVQKLMQYKYEVISEDSPYLGNVYIAYAEREIMLRATHCYLVKFNDSFNNPRIVEVIEELPKG
jgi:ribonuclease HI